MSFVRDGREQQQCEPAGTADTVHQPDAVRRQRGAPRGGVGVPVGLVVGVGVDVAVGLAAFVGVDVDVVNAAAPPDEKPHCQQHNDAADGNFGDLADDLGQVLVQKNERQANQYECGPVAQAPEEAHNASLPYLVSLLL